MNIYDGQVIVFHKVCYFVQVRNGNLPGHVTTTAGRAEINRDCTVWIVGFLFQWTAVSALASLFHRQWRNTISSA